MPSPPGRSRGLRLERVIGLTALHNSAVDVNPNTGDVAIPAGCIVTIYNPSRNRQTAFMRATKAISSLRYSSCGTLLAVGERGHRPAVTVWDITSHRRLAELKEHRFGVSCLAFSPDGVLLVSAGFLHDHCLHVWDWAQGVRLVTHKLAGKIHAVDFAASGMEFVTVGEGHVRFWECSRRYVANETSSTTHQQPFRVVEHRAVLMPAYKKATFLDVRCGRGRSSGTTLVITSGGLLALFGATRLMEKWVELETSRAFALSLSSNLLACGCQNGIIRLFDPVSLEYISTLPQPPQEVYSSCNKALSEDASVSASSSGGTTMVTCAAALCVRLSNDGSHLLSVYDDRSLFIWDIRDRNNVGKYRSFLYHSACVWDVTAVPAYHNSSGNKEGDLPENAFVSCSSDNTVRLWHLGKGKGVEVARRNGWGSSNSRELLRVIRTGDANANASSAQTKRYDTEIPEKPDRTTGLRCISVSPNGRHVASGDKRGNLRVHDLKTAELLAFKEAHDSEVLCLQYSPMLKLDTDQHNDIGTAVKNPKRNDSAMLLVSGSRDRLVHVYGGASLAYTELQTLENHSAAVTALRFSIDGRRLFSCGGDKTIVMSDVSPYIESTVEATDEPSVQRNATPVRRYRSVSTPGTIYDMDVDATNKYLATAGQDKRINLWSLATGKAIRNYKPEDECGELHAIRLDPAGMFAATCSFDKCIRLFDFYSGECVAKAAGHSELVTGLAFSSDCKRLVTSSSDGCIFVWKLAPEITLAMRDRLKELGSKRQEQQRQCASNPSSTTVQHSKACVDRERIVDSTAQLSSPSSKPTPVISSNSLETLRVNPPPSPETLMSPERRKELLSSQSGESRIRDREALHGILDQSVEAISVPTGGDCQHAVNAKEKETSHADMPPTQLKFHTSKLPDWARTKKSGSEAASTAENVESNSSLVSGGDLNRPDEKKVEQSASKWAMRIAAPNVTLTEATEPSLPAGAICVRAKSPEDDDDVVVADDDEEIELDEETVFFAPIVKDTRQSFEVSLHSAEMLQRSAQVGSNQEEAVQEGELLSHGLVHEEAVEDATSSTLKDLFGEDGDEIDVTNRQSLSATFRAGQRMSTATTTNASSLNVSTVSVSTAPRSPPPRVGKTKTLAQEREALKLQQRREDTANAVEQMRSKLRQMGILSKTLPKVEIKDCDEGNVDSSSKAQVEIKQISTGKVKEEVDTRPSGKVKEEVATRPSVPAVSGETLQGQIVTTPASDRFIRLPDPQQAPTPPMPSELALVPHGSTKSAAVNDDFISGIAPNTSSLIAPAPSHSLSPKKKGGQSSAAELALTNNKLPASPLSAQTARNASTSRRRLRSAKDARNACEDSLRQLRDAFANTLSVFKDVQDLEMTVSQATLPLTAEADAGLVTLPPDISIEDCSLLEVSGVVNALKSELGGFKREIENVIGEPDSSSFQKTGQTSLRESVQTATSAEATMLGEMREEQRRMMAMMSSLLKEKAEGT